MASLEKRRSKKGRQRRIPYGVAKEGQLPGLEEYGPNRCLQSAMRNSRLLQDNTITGVK